jgi:hypothetical protein
VVVGVAPILTGKELATQVLQGLPPLHFGLFGQSFTISEELGDL